MKNKLFLFAMLTLCLAACNQEPPVRNCTGTIVGTLGCVNGENREIFYKGYIVVTNHEDTILSFNLDVNDSIYVIPGSIAILPITIPYKFSYEILKPNDERYIHYEIPAQDAYHRAFRIPSGGFKQVYITRK